MTKDPATDSGLNVRLVAAFAGWKGIPWLCWAHSDLSPRLVLHADRVEFRVIRTRSKPYSSISRVDYRKWHYTENIVLEFTDLADDLHRQYDESRHGTAGDSVLAGKGLSVVGAGQQPGHGVG